MIKKLVATFARKLGYTIIPTWQLSTHSTVTDLRRRFEFLGINLVLDVGANEGQYRDMLRDQVEYRGPIISFEPVPHLAARLTQRAELDPNWTVVHCGLGSVSCTRQFHVMEDTQFSSFLQPSSDEVALFETSNVIAEQVPVTMSTLDDILPPLLKEQPSSNVFLKMDTQGFDMEVLKGGLAVLPHIAALQTEASVRRIYDGAPSYQEALEFLQTHGFVMSGIFQNNAGHFPLLIEFDCQMIRGDLVPKLA